MDSFRQAISLAVSDSLACQRTALTLGVFDGVHLGHQALVGKTISIAKDRGLKSMVLTFTNHPLSILAPPYCPKSLVSPERKSQLLKLTGTDIVASAPFTRSLSNTPASDFVRKVLVELCRVKVLVCGYDFSFGKGGEGNAEVLKSLGVEHDFSVHILQAIAQRDVNIKSTHIRDLLFNGRVEDAAELLSRPHEVSGIVVSGHGRGRTIGIPTANLDVPENMLIPARGVYYCIARAPEMGDKTYTAMVNIGTSPTFGENKLTVEAHLLDFDRPLNGQRLELFFVRRLRDEQKFPGIEFLIKQLADDRSKTIALAKSTCADRLKASIPI